MSEGEGRGGRRGRRVPVRWPPLRPLTLLFLVLLLAGAGVRPEKNKFYHMASLCKSHFLQQLYRKIDGAVLRSQNERNLDCAITFQTHSILQRFMLRFDLLQLDCNDHLFVYDGAHAVGSYKADLSCRNTKHTVGAIYTRTNFVTLKYVTDGWGTESNGFKLIITAVKDPKHACKDFRCTLKEFCIDNDLVCDDVNHCSDGSDEEASNSCTRNDSGTILGMNVPVFSAVAVGTLLALCAAVAAVVLCVCRRQRAVPSGATSSSTASANAQSQQQQLLSSANSTSAYPRLTTGSASDPRVERERNGYDVRCGNGGKRDYGGNWDHSGTVPRCHKSIPAGKPASPCGPGHRVLQRLPGPPLLPGKVRSSGSDSDISSSQKDEWFV